jgi:hypothetical protein
MNVETPVTRKCELGMLCAETEFWFKKFVPQSPGLALDYLNHSREIVIGDSW